MSALPEPPPLKRRMVRPLRRVALLAGFALLPCLIFAASADDEARRSVLHVVFAFAALMFAFRLIGKRELSQFSPFELVTLMLIPEILSSTVQGERTLLQGAAGLCTIFLLVLLVSLLSHRFPAAHAVFEASPTLLAVDGRLLEQNMNEERIAPDELYSEMRKQGIATLGEVRFAVLEGGGNITFIPRTPHEQPRADDPGPVPG